MNLLVLGVVILHHSFLLKDKTSGKMFEVHGGHCSCFGFEGQLQLEETTIEALKFRINNAKISLFNRRIR